MREFASSVHLVFPSLLLSACSLRSPCHPFVSVLLLSSQLIVFALASSQLISEPPFHAAFLSGHLLFSAAFPFAAVLCAVFAACAALFEQGIVVQRPGYAPFLL